MPSDTPSSPSWRLQTRAHFPSWPWPALVLRRGPPFTSLRDPTVGTTETERSRLSRFSKANREWSGGLLRRLLPPLPLSPSSVGYMSRSGPACPLSRRQHIKDPARACSVPDLPLGLAPRKGAVSHPASVLAVEAQRTQARPSRKEDLDPAAVPSCSSPHPGGSVPVPGLDEAWATL